MASISPISATGPLPASAPSVIRLPFPPGPAESAPAVPDRVAGESPVAVDHVAVRSGSGGLKQMATTSLWSMDFELPSAPPVTTEPKKPWAYSETPDITLNYAGGGGGGVSAQGWGVQPSGGRGFGMAPPEEEDDDFDLLGMLTWPMRTLSHAIGDAFVGTWQGIGRAAGDGVKAVVGAVSPAIVNAVGAIGHGAQQAAGAIGHGAQQVAGAIGHGLQQATDFLGNAASEAWKAVTGIRLW